MAFSSHFASNTVVAPVVTRRWPPMGRTFAASFLLGNLVAGWAGAIEGTPSSWTIIWQRHSLTFTTMAVTGP